MKVTVKTWRGNRDMPLREALVPTADCDQGVAERALEQAQRASEAVGSILEVLIKKGMITLDEAKQAAQIYDEIELHDD